MEILLSASNDIYTVSFNTTSKVIVISGVNNFPLDYSSIREAYSTTAAAYISPLSSANQFAWYRSNGLPIFVYLFTALPAGVVSGNTLNILIDIPVTQSQLSLQQKQATADPGNPGVLVSGEVPTGVINGTNRTFTLASTPIKGAITIAYGVPGGPSVLLNYGFDFTVVANVVTMNTAPVTGSSLFAIYYH